MKIMWALCIDYGTTVLWFVVFLFNKYIDMLKSSLHFKVLCIKDSHLVWDMFLMSYTQLEDWSWEGSVPVLAV